MNATMIEAASKISNGTFTVQNRVTGEHRTFRIRTQKEDATFAPGKRVVSLMTGSDNETAYTNFAFVTEDGIAVWSSKRSTGGYTAYAALLWSLAVDGGFSQYAEKYSLTASKKCIRCNRKLTTPESLAAGIGPECAGRTSRRNVETAVEFTAPVYATDLAQDETPRFVAERVCGFEECDGEPCTRPDAAHAEYRQTEMIEADHR